MHVNKTRRIFPSANDHHDFLAESISVLQNHHTCSRNTNRISIHTKKKRRQDITRTRTEIYISQLRRDRIKREQLKQSFAILIRYVSRAKHTHTQSSHDFSNTFE